MNRSARYSSWLVSLAVSIAACDDTRRHGEHAAGANLRADKPANAAPQGANAEPVIEGPPKKLYVKRFVVNVRSTPHREAPKLGYLRAGAIVQAKTAGPVSREECAAGWYELTTGGFVCNFRDVTAFDGRRPPERPPAQPEPRAMLPYAYYLNRRDGTPMYRRLPTDLEAMQYEGYRPPGMSATGLDGGVPPSATAVPVESPEPPPSVVAPEEAISATAPEPLGATPAPTEAEPQEIAPTAAETIVAAVPIDAGVPTLRSLLGEREGVVARQLVKGFYVSIDRDVRVRDRRYWRTLSNGYIPYHRLSEVNGSGFHGVALDGTNWDLPVAFVLSEHINSFRLDATGTHTRRGPTLPYHRSLRIVGQQTIRGTEYLSTNEGLLVKARDVRLIAKRPPPAGLGDNEKWIDVDLSLQTLVAYEGERPVFATLVSTGKVKDEDNPLLNHATPTGDFRITSKHVATTMDGDHAVDGPYSIEDVPYVMYFQLAYALHSAFWHNRFGRPKSHGCVNLAPLDAKWVFEWSTPFVPPAWHGAFPSADHPGTRLIIRGETP